MSLTSFKIKHIVPALVYIMALISTLPSDRGNQEVEGANEGVQVDRSHIRTLCVLRDRVRDVLSRDVPTQARGLRHPDARPDHDG